MEKQPLNSYQYPLGIVGILLLGLVLKIGLQLAGMIPFNADEAIVGLMGRHILQGNWPVFFYGQAYMGSLDATIIAVFFSVIGTSVTAIRIVQMLLFLGTIYTTIQIATRIFRSERAGLIAGLLMAIPSVNLTLYTTASLGGYGEALFIGNLLVLISLRIFDSPESTWNYPIWGFLAGLGLWAFGLTLIYSLPLGIWLGSITIKRLNGRQVIRMWILILLGGAIGAAPWLNWLVLNGPQRLLTELMGSAVAGVGPTSILGGFSSRVRNLILFGSTVVMGLRPPWEIRWLAAPLLPISLGFWLSVLAHMIRNLSHQNETRSERLVLASIGGALMLGYILTPFGEDPSGRYFLPLSIVLTIFAGGFLTDQSIFPNRWRTGLLILSILIFNLWGTIQAGDRSPPGLTTQFDKATWIDHRYDGELMAFLKKNNERQGYTNYWVAYPLAFLSDEELIFVPLLPYHQDFRYTTRDDRYAPYRSIVADNQSAAYITTHHPDLNELLRESFESLEVDWKEAKIGDFQVFYGMSRHVLPEEVGQSWLEIK